MSLAKRSLVARRQRRKPLPHLGRAPDCALLEREFSLTSIVTRSVNLHDRGRPTQAAAGKVLSAEHADVVTVGDHRWHWFSSLK
ncbi:hypothetical protein [Bosea sp. RAC05]|uniref:hypothetical protein n=1 Tax=Bosea sp. RAC05 TaxID=1842539 RepID=UPI0012371EE5|nr:hypothetical protein [Bosea sp. RAC05]